PLAPPPTLPVVAATAPTVTISGPPSPPAGWKAPSRPVSPRPAARTAGAAPKKIDGAKSTDAYLRGVSDYMAGHVEKARQAMRDALKLDSGNTRARTMLERIDRESRTR